MNLATEINAELWDAVRRSYESQAWSNAILDAIHHFSDVVRTKSGLQSDGTALAGQAFGGKDPKIRLNRLATESERNIQAGVEQLARGLYQAIRNPRSHQKINDTQRDCDSLIVFIGYLLSVIGHAKSAFSIDYMRSRISDENFVANKRYAELLLSEVPRNKLLDTLIATFEQRNERDARNQKHFFQACISSLDEEEASQFFEVVSEHLRTSSEDSELRSVFQVLEPSQWPLTLEADRMRSENRVIRAAASGKYSSQQGRCLAGGVATWSRSFLGMFSLKVELLNALYASLTSGSMEREDYVLVHFFDVLHKLAEVPPPRLIRHIRDRLNKGDSRYRDALEVYEALELESWIAPFRAQLESFKADDQAIPAPSFIDDDIPF